MAEVGDALEEVIELVEGPSYKVEGGEGGGGEGGNETEGIGEGGEGGEGPEGNPSVAEIISKGKIQIQFKSPALVQLTDVDTELLELFSTVSIYNHMNCLLCGEP